MSELPERKTEDHQSIRDDLPEPCRMESVPIQDVVSSNRFTKEQRLVSDVFGSLIVDQILSIDLPSKTSEITSSDAFHMKPN